ncbi:MAG: hypothetical protein K9N07_08545 [Candidatus Cloacimonetes bacterium]|nr:hypothetical protein [Candidatus Cloacimonadota bacterium]
MLKKIIVLSIALLLLFGCMSSNMIPSNYFILEYYKHSEKDALRKDEPFNHSVYIADTKIPSTYNRKQIVVRHFGQRITYSDNNFWGVKLSKIFPNLIKKRMDSYHIFKNTQRELFTFIPEYVIDTNVNNIEMYISEKLYQARLNIDFVYRQKDTDKPIVVHSANVEKVFLPQNYDTFVQTINEILLNETDKFAAKIIVKNTTGRDLPDIADRSDLKIKPELIEIIETEEEDSSKGLLLVPAISRTENEPYYKVYDKYGYEFSARMGEAIPLIEGTYTVEYGSGSPDLRMKKEDVEVHPRYKTIIEPDWGCLVVEIIDKNRNFAKVVYDVYDLERGKKYGSEFPAQAELGEQDKIWILNPGYYKITVNSKPFNTYTDFTTVLVEKGSVQKLTIVMNTDEEGKPTTLAGAGILEESLLSSSLDALKFSSAIHMNGNMKSDNELDKDNPELTITMNSQLENFLIYDKDPFYYNMKNFINLGVSKSTDTDFRLASDEFTLKNTGIYYFLKNLGFYGRFDARTHFFIERQYSSDKFYYQKFDENGIALGDSVFSNQVKVKPSFFPIKLKEGIGINFRILNLSRANMNIRAGFGVRQFFNNNVFIVDPDQTNVDEFGIEHRVYNGLSSTHTTGTELSLVSNFQLFYNVTYSSDADFYFPFDRNDDYTFEWENSLKLNLLKYISLDYKLNLKKLDSDSGMDYLIREHSLYLRVTYFLR